MSHNELNKFIVTVCPRMEYLNPSKHTHSSFWHISEDRWVETAPAKAVVGQTPELLGTDTSNTFIVNFSL